MSCRSIFTRCVGLYSHQGYETREALSEAYTQDQLNYVGNDDHPKDVRWKATAFTAQDIQEAYKEGFRAGHSYARMVYQIS